MTTTTPFLLRPLEAVYFGPPASMPAGDAHRGESLFPPTPRTWQGIVRSRLLAAARPALDLNDWSRAAREQRRRLVGPPERLPDGWQLAPVLPADTARGETRPWVPTPRFLLRSATSSTPVIAHPMPADDCGETDLGAAGTRAMLAVGAPEAGEIRPCAGWLDARNLYWALGGPGSWSPDGHSTTLPPFVAYERRSGVEIDGRRHAAKHGLLYFLRTVRFRPDSGLLGELTGELDSALPEDALHTGLARAGRGGRLAAFERAPQPADTWRDLRAGRHLPEAVPDGTRFWLVTQSPARLESPHDPTVRIPLPAGVTIEFCAALTGRAELIGGYDMTSGSPRANRGYVPAGSAWLLRVRGSSDSARAAARRALHGAYPLGDREEARFGFGYTFVGTRGIPTERSRGE